MTEFDMNELRMIASLGALTIPLARFSQVRRGIAENGEPAEPSGYPVLRQSGLIEVVEEAGASITVRLTDAGAALIS